MAAPCCAPEASMLKPMQMAGTFPTVHGGSLVPPLKQGMARYMVGRFRRWHQTQSTSRSGLCRSIPHFDPSVVGLQVRTARSSAASPSGQRCAAAWALTLQTLCCARTRRCSRWVSCPDVSRHELCRCACRRRVLGSLHVSKLATVLSQSQVPICICRLMCTQGQPGKALQLYAGVQQMAQ